METHNRPQKITELHAGIRALGRATGPDAIAKSAALYQPLHEAEPYADIALRRDIAYGPDDRHRLDIFAPADGANRRPVLVFVHGGGFVGGEKSRPGSPYNDNVALWAARNGLVGVNVTYRLAPDHPWPAAAEDVARAVARVGETIAEYGGDPHRLFLMGTSAGAAHAGSVVAFGKFGVADALAGAILLSGYYDPSTAGPSDRLMAYYGDEPATRKERAALPGLIEGSVPLMLTLAEFDPLDFEQQALQFVNAYWQIHGVWPRLIRLMGHNHFTTTKHLNAEESYLGAQILEFIGIAAADRGDGSQTSEGPPA